MGKLENLKNQHIDKSISLIEMLDVILQSNKSKYIDMSLNLLKDNMEHISNNVYEMKKELSNELEINIDNFKKLSDFQIVFLYRSIEEFYTRDQINTINKFISFNERGLIPNKDVTTYKTFEQLNCSVAIVDLKLLEKDLEKDTIKIYEDDEWLLIKPMSWFSSTKYGSSTKWCTSMKHNPEYFLRYSKEGILIYCLNKQTGKHVAVYKRLVDETELSFWNTIDRRIDSLESGLPLSLLEIIKVELSTNVVNYDLLSNEQKEKEQRAIIEWELSLKEDESPMPTIQEDYEGIPRATMNIIRNY